jgi:hypothetical protein
LTPAGTRFLAKISASTNGSRHASQINLTGWLGSGAG